MKRQLALSLCCALAAGCGTSAVGDGARVHDAALSPVNWGQCCPSVPMEPPMMEPPAVQPPAMEPPMVEPSAPPSEEPAPPEATTVTVTVRNFEFVPSQITVAPGTTVTWNFEGPAQHTSTSDAGSAMTWDSGLKGPGESFSLTFNEKGTFSYHCTPHPRMQGTVTVEDAPGTGKNQTGDTTPPDGGEDTGGSDGGEDTGSTGGSGY